MMEIYINDGFSTCEINTKDIFLESDLWIWRLGFPFIPFAILRKIRNRVNSLLIPGFFQLGWWTNHTHSSLGISLIGAHWFTLGKWATLSVKPVAVFAVPPGEKQVVAAVAMDGNRLIVGTSTCQ